LKKLKKIMAIFLMLVTIFSITACAGDGSQQNTTTSITVFNWGDYIDESVLKDFEEE
jgi:spermidine/putrescine transport system substrate-binding protein